MVMMGMTLLLLLLLLAASNSFLHLEGIVDEVLGYGDDHGDDDSCELIM
jgi:hypothetical protein